MPRKIVVVGCGAAGVSAALNARKTDRGAEITLTTLEPFPEYSRCGLPYTISGVISPPESLLAHPLSFYDQVVRVNLLLETEVFDVDSGGKRVFTRSLTSGSERELEYDSLILATGADPRVPPIPGRDLSGVFTLRTLKDVENIRKRTPKSRSAVIVGGGLIGIETAEAFTKLGIKTTVIDMAPEVVSGMLDPNMAKPIRTRAEEEGVRFILGKGIDEILGKVEVQSVRVGNDVIPADLVLLSIGVRPNTSLAEKMGAEIGPTRGIKVDDHMRTTVSDVYAVGDCAEYVSLVTGEPCLPQLGTLAVREGKVAGINAAGGEDTLTGILGTAVTKVFGLEAASTGLTSRAAERAGMKPIVGKISSLTKPEYYPGGKDIIVKILAEPESGRMVGAQIVGWEEVAQRINVFALAIQKQCTVRDIVRLETCYAPPVAPTWDPMTLAAESASRRLGR